MDAKLSNADLKLVRFVMEEIGKGRSAQIQPSTAREIAEKLRGK